MHAYMCLCKGNIQFTPWFAANGFKDPHVGAFVVDEITRRYARWPNHTKVTALLAAVAESLYTKEGEPKVDVVEGDLTTEPENVQRASEQKLILRIGEVQHRTGDACMYM